MGLRVGLGRVRCAAGLHAGTWEPSADGTCEQARTCSRCGEVRLRTDHELSDWAFARPDDETCCLMERHCSRCRLAETATRHEPRWRYESDGRCEGQLACERCGAPSGKPGTRHQWGPWMPDKNATVMQNPLSLRASSLVRACRRCDHQERMK